MTHQDEKPSAADYYNLVTSVADQNYEMSNTEHFIAESKNVALQMGFEDYKHGVVYLCAKMERSPEQVLESDTNINNFQHVFRLAKEVDDQLP